MLSRGHQSTNQNNNMKRNNMLLRVKFLKYFISSDFITPKIRICFVVYKKLI